MTTGIDGSWSLTIGEYCAGTGSFAAGNYEAVIEVQVGGGFYIKRRVAQG